MKSIFKILILSFFTGQVFISCKKDKDAVPPVISVLSPRDNNSFSVFDTLEVNADISDDSQLASVSIQLMNENLTPALSLSRKTVSGKNYSLRADYIIYDSRLLSGIYYLRVTASDGENETKEYVKLYISESASSSQGIFIISTPGTVVNVSFLDSALNAQPFITRYCDYTASCVSSKNQYINLLGEVICGLNSFRIKDKVSQWDEPAMGSSTYFTHLDFYNEISYVSYYGGNIRGFDKNGATQFSAVSNAGYYPLKTFLHNTYLLVEEREKSGPGKRISVFYSTGSYRQSVSLPADVVAFAGKDDDNVFLFGNEGAQGKILLYKISGNTLWSPYPYTMANFKDAVQINSNTFLVALPDAVYKYNYSPVNFVEFIQQAGVEKLCYDEVNNIVLASAGAMLGFYHAGSGQQLNAYTHSQPIRNFHLLYNK